MDYKPIIIISLLALTILTGCINQPQTPSYYYLRNEAINCGPLMECFGMQEKILKDKNECLDREDWYNPETAFIFSYTNKTGTSQTVSAIATVDLLDNRYEEIITKEYNSKKITINPGNTSTLKINVPGCQDMANIQIINSANQTILDDFNITKDQYKK